MLIQWVICPRVIRSPVLYAPSGTRGIFTTGFEHRALDQEEESVTTPHFESER
jgi:hypothetical protein